MATELRGIGIGREAAVGEVYRWQRAEGVTEHRKASGSAGEEKDSLTTALAEGVTEVRAQAGQSDADTAAILEALVMIFEDDELVSMASPHLDEGWDAATALYRALDDLSEMMGDDEIFNPEWRTFGGLREQ